jgi:putative aldouronate transport system substrate-binding protein
MRKHISLFIALCLILSMIGLPALAADPVVITVGRSVSPTQQFLPGEDINNNIWYREYEKALGIKIQHEWTVMDSEYATKLNLAIASGKIPNIVKLDTQSQLNDLVNAGLVTDITDVYNQYASDATKTLMAGDGGAAMNMCTYNGRLMALPYLDSTVYQISLMWIRQDWLDKLGLKVPTTMEELQKVAYAFTYDDPDGNGIDDTKGIALSDKLFNGTTSLTGFLNGYHAYPKTWLLKDGKVAYGSVQPEMKQGLAALADMYSKGLIDTDFAVKDTGKVCEEVKGRKFGILFGYNWSNYSTGTDQDAWLGWTVAKVPSVDGKDVTYSTGSSCTGYYVISADCKNPEALVQLMNLYIDIVFGDYTDLSKGNPFCYPVGADGKTIPQTALSVVGTLTGNTQTVDAMKKLVAAVGAQDEKLLAGAVTETDKYGPSVDYLYNKNTATHGQYYQYAAFKTSVEDIGADRLLATAFSGSTETMDAKWSILNDYEIETFTKIIMGEAKIDEFDAFVQKWNSMGGDQVISEISDVVIK